MIAPLLRIGTRGSPLALAQTELARGRLTDARPELNEPGAIEVVIIRTTGDVVLDRTLAEIGGKGLFTKEIDEAMLGCRIDLAVHSAKDLPTWLPPGICLAAVLPRGDPRDVLVSSGATTIATIPPAARIGTASLRRQAQLLARRPDLRIEPMRGNIGTRLDKVAAGIVDGTVLAFAGLKRLGLDCRATALLDASEMLPAIAQAAIALTARTDDERTVALLMAIDDRASAIEVTAERALLAALDGSCRTPIAGLARLHADDGSIDLRALIARPDGTAVLTAERLGLPAADAAAIGRDAGEELRGRAGPGFFG